MILFHAVIRLEINTDTQRYRLAQRVGLAARVAHFRIPGVELRPRKQVGAHQEDADVVEVHPVDHCLGQGVTDVDRLQAQVASILQPEGRVAVVVTVAAITVWPAIRVPNTATAASDITFLSVITCFSFLRITLYQYPVGYRYPFTLSREVSF